MSPENNQLLATWMLVHLRLAGSTKSYQRTKIMCIVDTRDQKTESLRSRRTFEWVSRTKTNMATTINQMRKKISRAVSENPKYKTSSRAFNSKTVGRYKRLITQFCQLHIVKTSNWLFSFWRTTSTHRCSPSRIEVDVSLKKNWLK